MAAVKLAPASGKVTGTHNNIPLLVIPSAVTNVGTLTTAEANSVRFYADSAYVVELAREVTSADELHYKTGSSYSSSSESWMDWDGVRADYAAGDTYGRNAVWSDYECVFHQNNANDSAGKHNVTANGGVTLGGISGKVGAGTDFDGTNDSATHTGTTLGGKVAYSIQFWANPDSVNSRAGMVMNTDGTSFGTDSFGVEMRNSSNGDLLLRNSTTTGAGGYSQLSAPTGTMVTGQWQKITACRNGSNAVIYKNGSSVAFTNSFLTAATNNLALFGFGAFGTGAFLYYNGLMDEVRIANFQVSADWETTEYQNQNDNGAFWVATPEDGGFTPTPLMQQMMMASGMV